MRAAPRRTAPLANEFARRIAAQVLVVAGSTLSNLNEVSSGESARGPQFYVFLVLGIIVTVRTCAPSGRPPDEAA